MGEGDNLLLLQHPDPEYAVATGENRLPQLVVDDPQVEAAVAVFGSTRSTARMPST
jgi:hypothetical protein